jgi:dihydropteroate synthase-like protein
VITPIDRKGAMPRDPAGRVRVLEENIRRAKQLGITKVIGDLILDPVGVPGITKSLVAFYEFSIKHPEIPLLFGVGNVTELIDADSIGINALMAGIASELNVSILLTTEESDKTVGSVRELAIAAKMMFLTKKRASTPKDLGLALLVLKSKRSREEPYDPRIERNVRILTGKKRKAFKADPKGSFRIMIDRSANMLVALHFRSIKSREPDVIIKGRSAEEICTTIIESGLVSRLDHAAYLGRELAKAEVALKTGKDYAQDAPLFYYRSFIQY